MKLQETAKGVTAVVDVDAAAPAAVESEVAAVIFALAGTEAGALRGSVGQAASVTNSLEITAVRTVAIVPAADADAAAEASEEHYFVVLFAAETAYLEVKMLYEQDLC